MQEFNKNAKNFKVDKVDIAATVYLGESNSHRKMFGFYSYDDYTQIHELLALRKTRDGKGEGLDRFIELRKRLYQEAEKNGELKWNDKSDPRNVRVNQTARKELVSIMKDSGYIYDKKDRRWTKDPDWKG